MSLAVLSADVAAATKTFSAEPREGRPDRDATESERRRARRALHRLSARRPAGLIQPGHSASLIPEGSWERVEAMGHER
jgi:hypothetical protein